MLDDHTARFVDDDVGDDRAGDGDDGRRHDVDASDGNDNGVGGNRHDARERDHDDEAVDRPVAVSRLRRHLSIVGVGLIGAGLGPVRRRGFHA